MVVVVLNNRHLELCQWEEAYRVASLGVTEADWRTLAMQVGTTTHQAPPTTSSQKAWLDDSQPCAACLCAVVVSRCGRCSWTWPAWPSPASGTSSGWTWCTASHRRRGRSPTHSSSSSSPPHQDGEPVATAAGGGGLSVMMMLILPPPSLPLLLPPACLLPACAVGHRRRRRHLSRRWWWSSCALPR